MVVKKKFTHAVQNNSTRLHHLASDERISRISRDVRDSCNFPKLKTRIPIWRAPKVPPVTSKYIKCYIRLGGCVWPMTAAPLCTVSHNSHEDFLWDARTAMLSWDVSPTLFPGCRFRSSGRNHVRVWRPARHRARLRPQLDCRELDRRRYRCESCNVRSKNPRYAEGAYENSETEQSCWRKRIVVLNFFFTSCNWNSTAHALVWDWPRPESRSFNLLIAIFGSSSFIISVAQFERGYLAG